MAAVLYFHVLEARFCIFRPKARLDLELMTQSLFFTIEGIKHHGFSSAKALIISSVLVS